MAAPLIVRDPTEAGVDIQEVVYDAFLANDRTLEDPEVFRVERGGRVSLRLTNGATATTFWLDLGRLEGRLVALARGLLGLYRCLVRHMYGFPLTLYLLAGWLGTQFPSLEPMSHDAGHLWPAIFGWSMDPDWSPFHLLSVIFIGGGLILIATSWRVLHEAQREGRLATAGPYALLRHPQYAGFALIMIAFFLQWPTLVTTLMMPILLVMYWRLARREQREVEEAFGDQYRRYPRSVPAFLPRLGGLSTRETP